MNICTLEMDHVNLTSDFRRHAPKRKLPVRQRFPVNLSLGDVLVKSGAETAVDVPILRSCRRLSRWILVLGNNEDRHISTRVAWRPSLMRP